MEAPSSKDDEKEGTSSSLTISRWKPDPTLSVDENYYDYTHHLTRVLSKNLLQGSMHCIITGNLCSSINNAEKGTGSGGGGGCESLELELEDFNANIICSGTNAAVFSPLSSDLHAEAAAITSYAAKPTSTSGLEGATCYVTMPPCKNCFTLLCGVGIRKIVTCREMESPSMRVASERGIEVVLIPPTDDNKARRDAFFADVGKTKEEREEIKRRREDRKRAREDRKRAKKEQKSVEKGDRSRV